MTLVLGIDEAGRGPVIGPLVISGVLINKGEEEKLVKIGAKDSKLVPVNQRERIFDKIIDVAKSTQIITIEVDEIDKAVESTEGMNLNWLEAKKSAEIINEFKPDVVILDSPHPIAEKYGEYVRELLDNKSIEIISEHKADENYPLVGAASILAKVTREREMEKIKMKYGDVGPGYPANPITKKFVEENFEKHPEIFRKSWATFKNQVKKKNQKNLTDYK